MTTHYLERLFAPRSVALVGASERHNSLGRVVLENLVAGEFRGTIDPVNPKYTSVLGRECAPSVSALATTPDLAVIVTAANAVSRVIDDCAAAGVRHAIVLAGGFGETGPEGRALEAQLQQQAKSVGLRLIGPNSVGMMRPELGLNATFARTGARSGPIALIAQSGAVCTALVDWAWSAGFGFSSVVSTGAAIDLDIGEILDYFVHDPATRSILLYVEGVRESRRFVSAMRAAARSKPIVVMKTGRHAPGQQAARSHTGAIVGSDAVFDSVIRRCGAVRARTYNELFALARLLATDRLPAGDRIATLTNGGGPGVMAADAAAEAHLTLSTLAPDTIDRLNALLPAHWSHGNPIDIIGDATADRFAGALEIVLDDAGVDGVITLFCPQAVLRADEAASALLPKIQGSRKPVLSVWLGEHTVHEARDLVEEAGMPAFATPESSVIAFGGLAEYQRAQRLLMEVPDPLGAPHAVDCDAANALFTRVAAEGRTVMTEPESKQLLTYFGVPVPRTIVARTRQQAETAATTLGFPVALKIFSRDISHKSDVSGVRLNLRNAAEVGDEYDSLIAAVRAQRADARIDGVAVQPMVEKRYGRELAIGVSTDAVFGPIISFGTGGVAIELLADNAVELPPLSQRLAEALIDRTRIAKLMASYRHIPAVQRDAVVDMLLSVSDLVVNCPWLAELDINPVLVDDTGAMALDARVVIDPTKPPLDDRYRHMAIHPYPTRLVHKETLRDGTTVLVRPIRPEDARRELAFVEGLSDQSRYLRFFTATKTLSPRMLARLTQVDYDNEIALIAIRGDAESGDIVAVARYSPMPDASTCEFAVTVGDDMHDQGLGRLLMHRLITIARDNGYTTMMGEILSINQPMLTLASSLGFTLHTNPEDAAVTDAVLAL